MKLSLTHSSNEALIPPPGAPPLVFVYGTLKRGLENHEVLKSAGGQFICAGMTAEKYPLVEREFPFLLHNPGQGHRVEGEIYLVESSAGWSQLDDFEGHPTFYRRQVISIKEANGTAYSAWAYFLASADGSLTCLPMHCSYGCNRAII